MRRIERFLLCLWACVPALLLCFTPLFSITALQSEPHFLELDRPDLPKPGRLSWSPSGDLLALSADTDIYILSPSFQEIGVIRGHTGRVNALDWSPDGRYLASGSSDMTVRIWDAQPGPTLGKPVTVLQEHNEVFTVSWNPISGSNQLAVETYDSAIFFSDTAYSYMNIRIWDVSTSQVLVTLPRQTDTATELEWSPSGTQLAISERIGGFTWVVNLWDTRSGQLINQVTEHLLRINTLAWNFTANQIASGSFADVIPITNPTTAQTVYSSEIYGWGEIYSLDWNPAGTRIAAGTTQGTVIILDVPTGQVVTVLEGLTDNVYLVDWNPVNDLLATISSNGQVRIWDLSTLPIFPDLPTLTPFPGTPLPTFTPVPTATPTATPSAPPIELSFVELIRPELGQIYDVAWHPRKPIMALGTDSGIWLFDANLNEVDHFIEHTGLVYTVDWRSDGLRLASGGADGTIRIWDTDDKSAAYGTSLSVMQDDNRVTQVAWSPEIQSQLIVSQTARETSADAEGEAVASVIRLWNVDKGQLDRTLDTLPLTSREVIWSSDGENLYAAGLATPNYYYLYIWYAAARTSLRFTYPFSAAPIEALASHAGSDQFLVATHQIDLVSFAPLKTDYHFDTDGRATSLAWQSEGQIFAAGTDQSQIVVIDVATAQHLAVMRDIPGWGVPVIDWSADGTRLASLNGYDSVRVWDASAIFADE